jgi:hypothetical protein
MAAVIEIETEDTFEGEEPKSSRAVLAALGKAEDAFRDWQATCQVIDEIYNLDGEGYGGLRGDLDGFGYGDAELDLFWASYEILKPAVYARPPQPVVAPLFKDGRQLHNTTAEVLERCAVSVFKRTDIQDVMLHARDDLIFTGRGALWVRHEVEDGKHGICVEHKDRLDFLHEPARKWAEVGWVGGAAWMTRKEMRKRFSKHSGKAYQDAKFTLHRDEDTERDPEKRASVRKAKVWEVWHKADNRVYWVTEGVEVLLDSGEPHLKLDGFFPCPKPAYATLRRRSLIPVPDWERYAIHFRKISELTRRIYKLLDDVRMKGLIPAGSDVGDAIEELVRSDDDRLLVPVQAASLMQQGAAGFVVWLPLGELATAIQGLIEARAQLIQDFYQLSGISDIMRGASDAQETLGAQELKSQYGSVRVREKSNELQRVAADAVKIAAEIIAEKFPQETLLELSQLELRTKAEIAKRVDDIEKAAEEELKALRGKAEEAMAQQEGQADPAQAQAMLQQAQQQIFAKYAPMLQQAEQMVPVEDVVKLLRDDHARAFIFEIESSSTILTDELSEKRSRNEFMGEFANAQQALMGLAGMGEQGAKLAGSLMKFVLAPYRVGRELDGAIDEFIDAAPQMASAAGEGDDQGLAEAQNKLAEAEMQKARAQMAKVEADSALRQAEMQRKMGEMQQKAQADQAKVMAEAEKLRQSAESLNVKAQEAMAKVDLIRAQTMKALAEAGVVVDSQQLDEFKSLADIELRANDQAMKAQTTAADQQMRAEQSQVDREFRERGENRADMQTMQPPQNGARP